MRLGLDGRIKAVKLRVDDITADVREIAFSEPEGDINRALGLGPIREYRLEGPVNVALTYYRAGTELFFRGEFTSAINPAMSADAMRQRGLAAVRTGDWIDRAQRVVSAAHVTLGS